MQNIEMSCALKTDSKKKKAAIVIKVVLAVIMFAYFFSIKEMYVVQHDFFLKRIVFVCGLFAVAVILSVFDFRLKDKIDRGISVFLAVMSPFTAWILSEIIINDPKCAVGATGIFHKEPLWIGISLSIIILIYFILLFVTNSMRIAAIAINLSMALFSTVVCIVYEFRGIPMMAPDVLTAGTATSVMGNYTIQLTFKEYIAVFLCLLLLYVFLQMKEVKVCGSICVRGVLFVAAMVCSVVFTQKIILSDYMEDQKINIRMFRPMESYQKYGAVVTFARSIGYARVDKPEGYSTAKVQQITKKYDEISKKSTATTKKYPNIITVVNETYADIKVLGDFKTNEEYMPFYKSMKENCIKGYTYASIVGGQTANTEFEFLTGNTLGFLSAGTTAFQLYIHDNMPSLVSNLKQNGYSGNKAMHPFNPYNYNRPAVYSYLGFSDFIDKFDFSDNVKMLREYISDDANVDKLISEYEANRKKTDQPFYMYNMTIQNHSPYDKDAANFKQTVKLEDSKYDASANRYLNLIKYSDASLKKMVDYFDQCGEPTIILFMGDHQPRLTDSFMDKITNGNYKSWTSEEMMKRYQVPFVIWANYDIKEQFIDKTSMNYLQSILFETAGVKMTGYQKFLNDVRKEVPTITSQGYWGKNGKFYQVDDKNSPYYDIIQEYRIIQYNMMFDTKNRVNSFFEVQTSK